MEAVGYFRTRPQAALDETVPTLDEDERAFSSFCQEHGYYPVATFVDQAPKEQRGYKQLSEFLQQDGHGFMVVVVHRPEDLADNGKEIARRLLEIEYRGAQVIATEHPDEDILALAITLWRQRRGGASPAARTMDDTLRSKALRGYGLGKTPFGYTIGADGRLEIVPEEARVVQEIYRLYLEEGMGLRRIARDLNDAATSTRRGSRWSVVTVRDILRNRTYTGTYIRFGIRVPSSHPAIIAPDVFRQALRKREQPAPPRADGRESAFALSGMAYCGACNGRMIGVSRRQSWARKRDGGRTVAEYRYYRCGSRVNQSVCEYHTWRADALETEVLKTLAQSIEAASTPAEDVSLNDLLATLRSRLRSLDLRFQRQLNAAGRGVLSPADLRESAVALVEEIQYLEQRIEAFQRFPDPASQRELWQLQQRQSLRTLQSRWPDRTAQERRRYLNELVRQVVVYDDHVDVSLQA